MLKIMPLICGIYIQHFPNSDSTHIPIKQNPPFTPSHHYLEFGAAYMHSIVRVIP